MSSSMLSWHWGKEDTGRSCVCVFKCGHECKCASKGMGVCKRVSDCVNECVCKRTVYPGVCIVCARGCKWVPKCVCECVYILA